jgi:hypothetical protein
MGKGERGKGKGEREILRVFFLKSLPSLPGNWSPIAGH